MSDYLDIIHHATNSNQKAELVQHYAEKLGVSTDTIYRQLRERFGSQRKRRADASTKKKNVETEAILQLKKLVAVQGMGTETAIKTLERDGYDLNISVSTANRWMAEENLGWDYRIKGKDTTPKRRFEAIGPNVVHQFDTTVSEQFYLKSDLSIGYSNLVYKNKPQKGPKLFLFALIDDYSRCTYGEYFIAETSTELEEFVFQAWRRKDNPTEFPFCGLPETFYTDNGSIEKSYGFKNACTKFGVEVKHHVPHHPWAKGKVESGAIHRIQRYFESRLVESPGKNLLDMNQKLYNFLVELNNERHSQTGEVPFERWMRIEQAKLRLIDDRIMLHQLFRKPISRQVSPQLEITIDNHPYAMPWKAPFINMVGKYIDCFYSPRDYASITVVVEGNAGKEEYEIQEGRQHHDFGEYKGTPNTVQKLALAGIEEAGLRKVDMFNFEKQEKKVYFDVSKNAEIVKKDVPEPMFASMLQAKMHIMKEMGGVLWNQVPSEIRDLIEKDGILSKSMINEQLALIIEKKEEKVIVGNFTRL